MSSGVDSHARKPGFYVSGTSNAPAIYLRDAVRQCRWEIHTVHKFFHIAMMLQWASLRIFFKPVRVDVALQLFFAGLHTPGHRPLSLPGDFALSSGIGFGKPHSVFILHHSAWLLITIVY